MEDFKRAWDWSGPNCPNISCGNGGGNLFITEMRREGIRFMAPEYSINSADCLLVSALRNFLVRHGDESAKNCSNHVVVCKFRILEPERIVKCENGNSSVKHACGISDCR